MNAAVVRPYEPRDREETVSLILAIQQEEFGVAITASDQPDLGAIPAFYQVGVGGFWVAEQDGAIVGTIGLKDIGAKRAALRKMFVAAPARGRERGVAAALLADLINHARRHAVTAIYLGSTDLFVAAHRFYERNGFALVPRSELPPRFPVMAVDTRFYRLAIGGLGSSPSGG